MDGEQYAALAAVYDWVQPEPLLSPAGSAAAFAGQIAALPARSAVLDCSAGTGILAVGLALQGFAVVASDASAAMLDRARQLATEHGVDIEVVHSAWEELGQQGWDARFAGVFCVGNSLAHAPGRTARRAALGQMAGVLAPGGLLVLTSRNWERQRAIGSGLRLGDEVIERHGRRGLVAQAWTVPADWEEPHYQDVAVALLADDGTVTSHGERLTLWPYPHEALTADLQVVGLQPEDTTYAPADERYLVTARRPG
jgi:SAM-dependent methyltransferase